MRFRRHGKHKNVLWLWKLKTVSTQSIFLKEVYFMDTLKEIWEFLKVRKKFWLAPIVVILLMFGLLIVLTQGSAVSSLVYVLF